MNIKLKSAGRGPIPSAQPNIVWPVRLTIPAYEALKMAGCKIETVKEGIYSIELTNAKYVPDNLHVVLAPDLNNDGLFVTGIRLANEPEYPAGEISHDYFWTKLALTPCPLCKSPLLWAEAGYVPGMRVCSGIKHHRWLLDL